MRREDVAEAAAVTAAAFQPNPSYSAMVPEAEERRAFLRWLFAANFKVLLERNAARCVFEGDTLAMVYVLTTPEMPRIGAWDMLRAGLL